MQTIRHYEKMTTTASSGRSTRSSNELPRLLQETVRENEAFRAQLRELRQQRDLDLNDLRGELHDAFERRLAEQRQKLKHDLTKSFEQQKAATRRAYETKIDAVAKIKNKEINSLQHQLSLAVMSKSQEVLSTSQYCCSLNIGG